MRKFILFAVFIFVLQVTTATPDLNNLILHQPYRHFLRQIIDSPYCTKPGFSCKTCSELVKCIQISPGKFEENLIQICSNDETCILNRCSPDHNPKCAGSPPFTCTATGTFPDPYDCQIYHVCIKGEDIVIPENVGGLAADVHEAVKCQGDYGFNILTTLCDNVLYDGNCPSTLPVPPCMSLGQTEPLGESSYYYVCVDNGHGGLRAILHLCPHGTVLLPSGNCGRSPWGYQNIY